MPRSARTPLVRLVRALEDDWRDTLDAVARSRSWPTSHDVAKLGARVVELSAAYNDPTRARAAMREAGAARLGFSFARDVPKCAAAVRELVATGAVGLGRPLKVLDLGAGLGASTWGLVRALEAAGAQGAVEATWVDTDAEALELGAAILRARQATQSMQATQAMQAEPAGPGQPAQGRATGASVKLMVRTHAGPIGAPGGAADRATGLSGTFDVILVGQVLSELDVAAPDDERCARHADILRSLLESRTAPGGALVVIEPALRDRARHLHRVRDAIVATSSVATVFAPCLHAAPCPALARENDWCHEDLAVDLPEWLVPVARAAGLRREGLTFSYLVLRHGGFRLVDAARTSPHAAHADAAGASSSGSAAAPHLVDPDRGALLRVVSDEIRTKGKRETFVCGELPAGGDSPSGAAPVATRARLMRLDRDASPGNSAWEELHRGDVIRVTPAPALERPRIGQGARVETVELVDALSLSLSLSALLMARSGSRT